MESNIFTNEIILDWLKYFADNTPIALEKIKMMDVTKKDKNLIPAVESNKAVMAFMEAGDAEIFYHMWNAGLGDCEVWYNEGSEPSGTIKRDKVKDMINRGINANAGMLVVNEKARNVAKTGLDSLNSSSRNVGSELRAVILSKLDIAKEDAVCIIGGESLAIEAAFAASEGTVIAVEYNQKERERVEEHIDFFNLKNVVTRDHVDSESFKGLPAPAVIFLVASASMEQELEFLLKRNPKAHVVIYTLDLTVAGNIRGILERFGMKHIEIIQVSVAKLDAKNAFEQQPAPWIITASAAE